MATFYMTHSAELYHYGVLGMHWGIRRYQPYPKEYHGQGRFLGTTKYYEKGGTIPKGTTLYRMSESEDPKTDVQSGRLYVSTSKKDHNIWKDDFVNYNRKIKKHVNDVKYEVSDDIKVANTKDFKNAVFTILSENKNSKEILLKNDDKMRNELAKLNVPVAAVPSSYKLAGYSVFRRTNTGITIMDALRKSGFDAVSDYHGRDTAYDPIIILNPDKVKYVSHKKRRTRKVLLPRKKSV